MIQHKRLGLYKMQGEMLLLIGLIRLGIMLFGTGNRHFDLVFNTTQDYSSLLSQT